MIQQGINKSKRITMLRVTNVIVTAFVAVWLFNGHYQYGGVRMVAAATLGGGGEEVVTTTRGTMMTTIVDGLPVASRKLFKRSKASKPDADDGNMLQRLLRSLVFDKAMALYHFSMQKSKSAALGNGRELLEIPDGYEEHACNGCLALFEKGEEYSLDTDKQLDDFCAAVVNFLTDRRGGGPSWYTWLRDNRDNVTNYCNELMQCPLRTSSTPVACCQSQGLCQDPKYDPAYYCKLNDNSGSSENYWIQTESKEKCDSESTALGCGNCKEDGISHTILDQAGMHDDLEKKITKGFVSYCRGGPCVWKTQKTQCMGLTNYPAITRWEDCKDACCDDYTCSVWQFDAAGARDQCWYGTNCDTTGAINAWSFGGIRRMGTDQAPDCVQPNIECASNYGTSDLYYNCVNPCETDQAHNCVQTTVELSSSGNVYANCADPCCGQFETGRLPSRWQCSPSKPTCGNFKYDPARYSNYYRYWALGTCGGVRARPTVECASDFGSSDPCCGQGGDDVAAQYQCSQSKPICVNYMYNIQWGTCQEWSY